VYHAFLAAMYYEYDDITNEIRRKFDTRHGFWTKDIHYETEKKIIKYAHSLSSTDKVDMIDLFTLSRQVDKKIITIIDKIFSYAGSFEQLKQMHNELLKINKDGYSSYFREIDDIIDRVVSKILDYPYRNLDFLMDLIEIDYDFNQVLPDIVTTDNKEAQQLLLRHLGIKNFSSDSFDGVHNITNRYILSELLATDPNNEKIRRLVFNSPGTLNDDEYLEVIDSYGPSTKEINELLDGCYQEGYDYLVGKLMQKYEIKFDR
jgi:hypothetical protein